MDRATAPHDARRRNALLAAACMATLCLSAGGTRAELPGPPGDLTAYEGTWLRVESEAERRALREAIDRVADGVPFVMRAIARLAMHTRIRPRERYEIIAGDDGESLQIATELGPATLLRLDGAPHESVNERGEPLRYTARRSASEVRTRWQRQDSFGTNAYRIAEGGALLVVAVQIDQKHFQVPLVYETSYRRASSARREAGPRGLARASTTAAPPTTGSSSSQPGPASTGSLGASSRVTPSPRPTPPR